MGGVASDVSVRRCSVDEEKGEYANHLITGLKHNDKAVLFDPSAPLVLLPMSGLLEFKTQKGKIVTKSFDEEYCYEEKISEHDFEKVNRINLRKLKSLIFLYYFYLFFPYHVLKISLHKHIHHQNF